MTSMLRQASPTQGVVEKNVLLGYLECCLGYLACCPGYLECCLGYLECYPGYYTLNLKRNDLGSVQVRGIV